MRLATAWQQIRASTALAWATFLVAGVVGGFLGTLVALMLFGVGGWEGVTAIGTLLAVVVAIVLALIPHWQRRAERETQAAHLRANLIGHLGVVVDRVVTETPDENVPLVQASVKAIEALAHNASVLKPEEFEDLIDALPRILTLDPGVRGDQIQLQHIAGNLIGRLERTYGRRRVTETGERYIPTPT